jgi:threonine/homoserine/homoserine lactone efflux protein
VISAVLGFAVVAGLRAWRQRPPVQMWRDRITGGVLVGFVPKVAIARRG